MVLQPRISTLFPYTTLFRSQLGDVLGFQQRIDRVDDAGGLAAPDGEVGLRQVRQQEGNRLSRPQTEAVEGVGGLGDLGRSEEHTSELQSRENLVCRLLLEKK